MKHDRELAARSRFARGALRNKSDPETFDRGVYHQPILVQRELAAYVNVHRLATELELPLVDPSISHRGQLHRLSDVDRGQICSGVPTLTGGRPAS